MTYLILDSTGSALNEYADEVSAHVALRLLIAEDAAAADHLVLVAYDDTGQPIGPALTIHDLPLATASVRAANPAWLFEPVSRAVAQEDNRYVAPAVPLARVTAAPAG